MAKFIVTSEEWYRLLHDAGAIDVEPDSVRRCVIDLKVGAPAMFYIEQYGDDEKLSVALKVAVEARHEA